MQGIRLNKSICEATCRAERKSYAEVARNDKTTPSPKVSVNFSDIVSDLLESNKSNSSMIKPVPLSYVLIQLSLRIPLMY